MKRALGFFGGMNITKIILPAVFCSMVLTLTLGAGKAGAVSECYDHWNGDAWHGSGAWALILCLDSPTMARCEARYRDGAKIADLEQHWSTDRDRVIWTNYDNLTAQYQVLLDIVCTGTNGLTYTFEIDNTIGSGFWQWGACGEWGDIGGPACVNDQDENALQVVYEKIGGGSGTVSRSPSGVNCSSSSSGTICYHLPGAPVTLTGNAVPGSVFLGWEGSGCEGQAPCTVTVDRAKTVTAKFAKVTKAPINYLLLKKDN